MLVGTGEDVGRAARRAPGRGQNRVHRLDRGGARHRRARGARRQAGHARARRQVAVDRVRRRRPRGRRHGLAGACSATPGRTAARARACSWSARALDEFMAHLEETVQVAARRRPARRGHADGPADLRPPARAGRGVRGRGAGRAAGHRAERPRVLVSANGALPGPPTTTAPCARRSSDRSSRCCRSTPRPR